MSLTWMENSIPMTDHECATKALEEFGVTILNNNFHQIWFRLDGQEYFLRHSYGHYRIKYQVSTDSVGNTPPPYWINKLREVYEQNVEAKLLMLRTEEEMARLESEKGEIQAEREAFELQRRTLINERKKEIILKAKKLGYRVKPTEENGQVRRVLVRRS